MSNQRRRHTSTVPLLALIALVLLCAACKQHSEEALTWCGPATAQMIIENDTKSGCPASILQEDLWGLIDAARVDTNWDSDPAGMAHALQASCAHWSWAVLTDADETSFMRRLTWFMQHYEYPAAVVLDTLPHNSYTAHAEHWVDVIGALTTPSADSPISTPVTVDTVIYVDPAPPVFGDPAILEVVSGATWFASLQAVDKPASVAYHGRYVAVIEPPENKGKAVARPERLVGTIRPASGIGDAALRQVRQLAAENRVVELLRKYDLTRVLKTYGLPEPTLSANLEKARALEPMLVNRGGGAYYLVPITFEGAAPAGRAQGAIAINAYDGSFQEVGLFKATTYLGKGQIIENARRLPPLAKVPALEAELVYSAGSPSAHRLLPLWRVTGGGRTFDFNPQGKEVRSPVRLRDVRPPVRPSPRPR